MDKIDRAGLGLVSKEEELSHLHASKLFCVIGYEKVRNCCISFCSD